MTGGWMRATSPNGDAAYEGVVQWTADLARAYAPPSRTVRGA